MVVSKFPDILLKHAKIPDKILTNLNINCDYEMAHTFLSAILVSPSLSILSLKYSLSEIAKSGHELSSMVGEIFEITCPQIGKTPPWRENLHHRFRATKCEVTNSLN